MSMESSLIDCCLQDPSARLDELVRHQPEALPIGTEAPLSPTREIPDRELPNSAVDMPSPSSKAVGSASKDQAQPRAISDVVSPLGNVSRETIESRASIGIEPKSMSSGTTGG